MKGVIHQAYFLPWLGYFSKIAFSDIFVVLDNVQFRKRHYFDRTRFVNMHGRIAWLSLPIGENFKASCRDVQIRDNESQYFTKMIQTLRESYAKARYYEDEWADMEKLLHRCLSSTTGLVKIDISLIQEILVLLNIPIPKIILASSLMTDNHDPSERILTICMETGIDTLIVGSGSSLPVHNWKLITDKGIAVQVQDYIGLHPVYYQSRRRHSGFQKGLSIIDAILNTGRLATKDFVSEQSFAPIPLLPASTNLKG